MSRPTKRRLRQAKTARRHDKKLYNARRLGQLLRGLHYGYITTREAEQVIEALYGKRIRRPASSLNRA